LIVSAWHAPESYLKYFACFALKVQGGDEEETYVRYFPAQWWTSKDWLITLFQRSIAGFLLAERVRMS